MGEPIPKFGLIAFVRKARDDRGARRVVSPKDQGGNRSARLGEPSVTGQVHLPTGSAICGEQRVSPSRAMGLFTTSSVKFQSDCLPSPIVAERRTAKSLTWFTDGKRRDQTRSGRQIMRNWASTW